MRTDFAKNIFAINSKLEDVNETMSYLKNAIEKTKKDENKIKKEGEKKPVKAAKDEAKQPIPEEQKDDDQFVRQYKPPSRHNKIKPKIVPQLDDLDEIEKALEEIQLPDANANKSKSSRNNAAQRAGSTRRATAT